MRTRATLLFLSLLTALAISGAPQENTAPGSASRIVEFPLFATDHQGKPYSGLNASEIQISEGKSSPQPPLALHKPEETPLLLGILIDTSASEKSSKNYRSLVEALPYFVTGALNERDDRVFVVTFAGTSQGTGLMTKEDFAHFTLNLKREGGTALYDGVVLASSKAMPGVSKDLARRVLLVVSDGEDNQSHHTRTQAIASAQSSGAAIFALGTSSGGVRGEMVLRTFAQETGGSYTQIKGDPVARTLDDIRNQIAAMYLASYRCVDSKTRGSGHALRFSTPNKNVKLRGPEHFY